MWRQQPLLAALFLIGGCAWPVQQRINQVGSSLADHPYDTAPESQSKAAKSPPVPGPYDSSSSSPRSGQQTAPVPDVPTDVQAVAWMGSKADRARPEADLTDDGVQTAAWTESQTEPGSKGAGQRQLDLNIPPQFPGSEAPRVELSRDQATLERNIERIYPELPPLPVEPAVQPGPDGKAYTLSDLQRLAAANSPALRQAVSDVEAANANLVQAKTYNNPTFTWLFDPANNNSTSNTQGAAIDQVIRTAGKQKLGVAAVQKDLDNAELAP